MNQELIDLLEKNSCILRAIYEEKELPMPDDLEKLSYNNNQALTLLKKPKCDTCGDSGKIPRKEKQHCRLLLCDDLSIPSCFRCQFYIHEKPCPKCQQPSSETKRYPIGSMSAMRKEINQLETKLDAETQRADKAEAMDKLYTKCNTERRQLEAHLDIFDLLKGEDLDWFQLDVHEYKLAPTHSSNPIMIAGTWHTEAEAYKFWCDFGQLIMTRKRKQA